MGGLRADLALAMYTRLVDRFAVDVSRQLEAAGIEHLVVKGPAIGGWLYDADEVRTYGDVDVLIRHTEWDRTVALLRSQGFNDVTTAMDHPGMESWASYPYRSAEGDVDLHATFKGLTADPGTVWQVFSSDTDTIRVPEGELRVPSVPVRLMQVAIHAAQHIDGKAIDDLERAVARVGEDEWRRAVDAASRVGGTVAFVSGLRLTESGTRLAERLGLPEQRTVETLLHESRVPLAEALNQLLIVPGLRAKARFAAREVFPTPEFLRWSTPLARRGTLGLAAAYLYRPIYLISRLPAAWRVLRDARRRATI